MNKYKVFSKVNIVLVFYVILMRLFISFNFSDKLSMFLKKNNIIHNHNISSAIGFFSNEIINYLIIIVIFYCFFRYKDGRLIKFKQKFSLKFLFKGLAVTAIIYRIFFTFSNSIVMPVLNSIGITIGNNVFSNSIDNVNSIIILIGSVIIAPIFEEFIFRYLVLNKLMIYGNSNAIVTSSVLFALLHQNLNQFIYTLPLGLILGYFAIKSNSIIIPIFMHMFFNLLGNITSISLLNVKKILLILIFGFTIYGILLIIKWGINFFKNRLKLNIDFAIFYKTPTFIIYFLICLFYFSKV